MTERETAEARARSTPYYAAYQNGFRAGEVDAELGTTEGAHFTACPDDALNADAFHEAQMWGYNDGLEGAERKSAVSIDMYLDNNFAI